MAARVVRKHASVAMIGIDHHNGIYYYNLFSGLGVLPGPPAPIPPGLLPIPPFSFHGVSAPSNWVSLDDKGNAMVLADGAPIVSKDHAAKHPVHIPPGVNVLLPITIYFGTATWSLGIASVRSTHGPVASSLFGPMGLTVNCGDPFSLPTGLFYSPGSVHVSPTPGDFGRAVLEWALQAVVELALSFGFSKLEPLIRVAVLRNLRQALWKSAEREAAEEAARWATKRAIVRDNGVFLKHVLDEDGQRVADAARRKIEGDKFSRLADPAEEKAAQQAADQFNKEADASGNEAAKQAGDHVDQGADPGKAAADAAKKATEDHFGSDAMDGGRQGSFAGPDPGEDAKQHVKDNLQKDALEKNWKKGAATDFPLEGGKSWGGGKTGDEAKKEAGLDQDPSDNNE